MAKQDSTRTLVHTALAGMIATGSLMVAATELAAAPKDGAQEKCAGVVKKGKNDCGTSKHGCAGLAKKDGDPEEWVYVPKGLCAKIVGGKVLR